jgi:calreticulin
MSADVDIDEFSGQTPYKIMFGPDVCGSTRRVHVILERDGQGHMIKKQIDFNNDELTHMYTLVLSQPSQTYRVLIDGKEVAAGNIVDDVEDMSSIPSMIADPNAVKPANWVEEAQIADVEDKKPEDWDESEEWTPRMIDNPEYKGDWSAPLIANPEYKPDPTVAVYNDLAFVGFDLWQVKAGTIFDNILVTDNFSEAQRAIDTLFTPFVELENAAYKVFSESSSNNTSEDGSDNAADNNAGDNDEEDQLGSDSSAENHTEL